MGRPKKTEGMTPEEIEKYEKEKRERYLAQMREYSRKRYVNKTRVEKAESRNEQIRTLEKRAQEAEARWFGTPNPEPFDFQRISREDYLRCQVWLLRWMCECFDGCLLPENVRKRLDLMIASCDEHLRIEDNEGYMRIIMA